MTLQGFTIARVFGDRHKEGFCLCGFSVHGMRTARIGNKTISRNTLHGIRMFDSSLATIAGSVIQENERYGVVLDKRPCLSRGIFVGYVAESANTGRGYAERDGCRGDVAFLITGEGGELDHRK